METYSASFPHPLNLFGCFNLQKFGNKKGRLIRPQKEKEKRILFPCYLIEKLSFEITVPRQHAEGHYQALLLEFPTNIVTHTSLKNQIKKNKNGEGKKQRHTALSFLKKILCINQAQLIPGIIDFIIYLILDN